MNYEMKNTPAPWHCAGGDNLSVEVNIGESTACISRYDKNSDELAMSREEMEANARLITAAPTLLTTCIEVLGCLENAKYRPYEKNLLKMAIHEALNISITDLDRIGDAVTEPDDLRAISEQNKHQL